MNTRFHLAFPVHDLEKSRQFYVEILGCEEGRSSDSWIDFNLFGHQIVAHLSPDDCSSVNTNSVDTHNIPCRHFGVILEWGEWEKLIQNLRELNYGFLISPTIRFKSKPGEQGTFFISDPSGNVLEFKTFKKDTMVFEKF